MAENRRFQEVTENGLEIIHLETNADMVVETTDKKVMTAAERTKLSGIEAGAEVNTIESISVNGGTPVTPDANKNVDLTILTVAGVKLTYNASTGVVSLLDANDTVLSSVDLPLELLIESGYYDSTNKNIVLVLANNTPQVPSVITIPVGDLVDEYIGDNTNIEVAVVNNENVIRLTTAFLNRIAAIETKNTNQDTAIDNIVNGTTKVGAASEADELSTARTIAVSGDASGSGSFDGSQDITINLSLANVGTAGTYSVVQTDAKGRVIAGGKLIEFGTTGQTTPSADLAVGGIFFEKIS